MQLKKKRKGRELMKCLNHTKSGQERRKRVLPQRVPMAAIIFVLASKSFKLNRTNRVRQSLSLSLFVVKPKVGVIFDE